VERRNKMSREKKMLRTLQWRQEQAEKELKEALKASKAENNQIVKPDLKDEEIIKYVK